MGLFSPTSKITPREWKRLRDHLDDAGLSKRNLDDLESLLFQALNEQGRSWGIDKNEARQMISFLREKRGSHNLTEKEINLVEQAFEKEL